MSSIDDIPKDLIYTDPIDDAQFQVDGAALSNARKLQGLTPLHLSELIGVGQELINSWEENRRKMRGYDLKKIGEKLNTSISVFAKKKQDIQVGSIIEHDHGDGNFRDDPQEIETMLFAARNEHSAVKALAILDEAQNAAERCEESHRFNRIIILKSTIMMEKSHLLTNFYERRELRRQAVDILYKHVENPGGRDDWQIQATCAEFLTSIFWAPLGGMEKAHATKLLKSILRPIYISISNQSSPIIKTILLSQKASIHRCMMQTGNKVSISKHRSHMMKCARRAFSESPNYGIGAIAVANSYHSISRDHKIDISISNKCLLESERFLIFACELGSVWGWLALSRFYRLEYQPLKAISAFSKYEDLESDKRKILRESYLLGESAINSWYKIRNTTHALVHARELLSSAYDAGYSDSRIVLALARVTAVSIDVDAGDHIISMLGPDQSASMLQFINDTIRFIRTRDRDFVKLRSQFSIGLDHGEAWNSIGTYIFDNHKPMLNISIACYEVANSLSSESAPIKLNLARSLILRGRGADVQMAQSLIDSADSKSRNSFKPWIIKERKRWRKYK